MILRKHIVPLVAFALVEVLYNAHALVPSNVVYLFNHNGYLYAKLDMHHWWKGPRDVQRCLINVAFGVVFLMLLWDRAQAFGVMAAAWFGLNAAEVYLTGGWFWTDWPDWILLAIGLTTWYLWVKWEPVKRAIMKIVHRKWS